MQDNQIRGSPFEDAIPANHIPISGRCKSLLTLPGDWLNINEFEKILIHGSGGCNYEVTKIFALEGFDAALRC